jgi:hypothetical protein
MTMGCPCCGETQQAIIDEGHHNRFAGSEIAGDMAAPLLDPIQGIVTGETEKEPAGALRATSSWYMTADVLPNATTPAQGDISDDMSGANNQDVSPMGSMGNTPQTARPTQQATTASWSGEHYLATIQKQASDSDVYYHGYADATSGKQMDDGLANLSMDYYQGYKQGLLYNETNLQSAPANIENINDISYYNKNNNAPGVLDHNDLRGMSDFNDNYVNNRSQYPKQ